MNDQPTEGPGAEPGSDSERAQGPEGPEAHAPFRRLRSGRRRAADTAPHDDEARDEATYAAMRDAGEPAESEDPAVGSQAPESIESEPADSSLEAEAVEPRPSDSEADAAVAEEDNTSQDEPSRDHHAAELLQAHPPVDSAEETPEGDDTEPEDASPAEALLNGEKSAPGVRKRRRRRRNVIMAIIVGIFAVILTVTVLMLQNVLGMWAPEDYPGPGEGEVTFTVQPGWGPAVIGTHLTEKGIVSDRQIFVDAIQQVDAANKEIHPGDYQLKYKMAAKDAATVLIGEAAEKVSYVAVKQNVRMGAVFETINKATGISLDDLEALNKQPEKFGLKKPVKNLEGFLHPGEYRFPLDTSAQDILQQLVDSTTKELTSQGVTDPTEQYRILKIASILQAEASPKDYAIVSGALDNRLKPDNKETDGLLQVDSSVIYGLDRYSLQLTKQEKADKGNKYNSYQHRGLPPTPIGSPANSAIEAAIHPQKNDYYYWVTVNTKTGETKFAKTYAQHQVYQQQFRDWCAKNEDVCK